MKPAGLASDLLDLFLPRSCLGCGSWIPAKEGKGLICARCSTLLRPPPPPRCPRCDAPQGTSRPSGTPCLECADWPTVLVSARSAVVMEAPADALIHALKYAGWRCLGEELGRRMARLGPFSRELPVLVPIPTTPARRKKRGYNQARVLAEVVAREWKAPLLDVLDRLSGGTQVRSGPAERTLNVQGSFRIRPHYRSQIRGREVILIDDVLTTGATALSAASELGRHDAGSVRLLAFARALPLGFEARELGAGPG